MDQAGDTVGVLVWIHRMEPLANSLYDSLGFPFGIPMVGAGTAVGPEACDGS